MKYLNITELKKLAPEKRLIELKKVLKLLENEEDKDEKKIEAVIDLIEETEEELYSFEKLVVGEAKKVVKDKKEEPEEKEQTLEERAAVRRGEEERVALTKREKDVAYSLSQKPIGDLYNKLSDVYGAIKTGDATDQDREYAQILRVALYKKEKDWKDGRYDPDEDAVAKMNQADRIVRYLKGEVNEEKQYKN